jgi:nucleotide-binding universal stress UspA family protein
MGRMEIVVGVNQSPQSQDALALGAALAQSLGASLTVANIYPTAYNFPSAGHVDAEWRQYLIEEAHGVVAWAREQLGDLPGVNCVVHPHRSSGMGLAEVAQMRSASMIVIGSAPGGLQDHIEGGSTSDQLLHGSPVPVALAPQDYRSWAPTRILRSVVAFRRNNESKFSLRSTIKVLQEAGVDIGASLELITLTDPIPRELRRSVAAGEHDDMIAKISARTDATLLAGHDIVRALAPGVTVRATALTSENVVRALAQFDWKDDDVLVLGSKGAGPIRRVFLGDMTYKMIRAATVPVIVVPRSAA